MGHTHACIHAHAHKHTHTNLWPLSSAASSSFTRSPAGGSARQAKTGPTSSPSKAHGTPLLVAHRHPELLLHGRFSLSPLQGLQCSQDPSDGVLRISGALPKAPCKAPGHWRCAVNTAGGGVPRIFLRLPPSPGGPLCWAANSEGLEPHCLSSSPSLTTC